MSYNNTPFTKENLDFYLKELAKEFRKLNGKAMKAELILIGGASVLANYGFRDMTYDVDAVIFATSAMKDAINRVGDRLALPSGWLNTDFVQTKSYTPKLEGASVYYKTFSNVLEIRTITSEFLIAMKLMSGRKYKNDLSDDIGILREHQNSGNPISYEQIEKAVSDLYGGWANVPADSKEFIEAVFAYKNYEALYQQYRSEELLSKSVLVEVEEKYPGLTNVDNINEILSKARQKAKDQSDDGVR